MTRFFGFLAALVVVWVVGFVLFVTNLPRESDRWPTEADGIVVYTGGGARIAAGMVLMQRGSAQRLLISGVNPGTSREALIEMNPEAKPIFDCCVDLGIEAQSTEGNAAEVRDWALQHGFKRIILVTSDYHMPRALVETRARLKGVTLKAYPVASGFIDRNGRPSSREAWKQLAFEYSKYLASHVKTRLAGTAQ